MTQEVVETETRIPSDIRRSVIDRWTRSRVHSSLSKLQSGEITLVEGPERTCLGNPLAALARPYTSRIHASIARLRYTDHSAVQRPLWMDTGAAMTSVR